MKKILVILSIVTVFSGCESYLDPKPVDLLIDELVIVDLKSAENALGGMYREFTQVAGVSVIAADFMSDNLKHNGTFPDYSEMDDKRMSIANGQALATWDEIYELLFICNFILEKVSALNNITSEDKTRIIAQANFFRAYAYYVGVNIFGAIPLTTTSLVTANRDIARTSVDEIESFIESELLAALDKLPTISENDPYFITNGTVKAMLARFYFQTGDYAKAEQFATEVITGDGVAAYSLAPTYTAAIAEESSESILEVYYDNVDNPGTDNNYGLWNLFAGRREIIPSDSYIAFMQSFGGNRFSTVSFNPSSIGDRDNGYTIARYGTNGSNIQVIRLAEIYLIRAEARAQLNNLTTALADLNLLRSKRGFTVDLTLNTQPALLAALADERRAELAFEGNRWFDLKRAGTAAAVLGGIPGWDNADLLFPIPQNEILYNPSINPEDQNPGY